LHHAHDQLFRACGRFRRAVGFGNQNIVIGQHINLARVHQPVGDFFNLQTLRHFRHFALFPRHAFRHLHRRQQEVFRFREFRIGPDLFLRIERGAVITAAKQNAQRDGQRETMNVVHAGFSLSSALA